MKIPISISLATMVSVVICAQNLTFDDAKKYCESKRGFLFGTKYLEENSKMLEKMKKLGWKSAWIANEGSRIWPNYYDWHDTYNGYDASPFWAPDRPSIFQDLPRLCMEARDEGQPKANWFDVNCFDVNPFICVHENGILDPIDD